MKMLDSCFCSFYRTTSILLLFIYHITNNTDASYRATPLSLQWIFHLGAANIVDDTFTRSFVFACSTIFNVYTTYHQYESFVLIRIWIIIFLRLGGGIVNEPNSLDLFRLQSRTSWSSPEHEQSVRRSRRRTDRQGCPLTPR